MILFSSQSLSSTSLTAHMKTASFLHLSTLIGLARNTINKSLEQHCRDGKIKEQLRLKHQHNSTFETLKQKYMLC